jgi:ATP-binding cassette subfamily C protein LapB
MKLESLSALILQSARLSGQAVQRSRKDHIAQALARADAKAPAERLARLAWKAAGLAGRPRALALPRGHDCPFVAWHAERGWRVIAAQNADGSWLAQDAKGALERIADLDGAECVSLPAKAGAEGPARTGQLIRGALWRRKGIFAEALFATFFVNVLALATSIFSMQVYDRVIPNHGFQTLWVLSIGVAAALAFDLLLKQVRSYTVEKTATGIDAELSKWFFQRLLGIRLEARPPAIGTLASQVKGFEMVRGVMSATSIFMLADVPFALFFIAVIGLVNGWMVLVPAALLPLALITGLMFQRQVARHTLDNQGQNNRKTGLLVESIDGAESLKANAAEWKLQARYDRLVDEAGDSDYRIKHYSALSQQLTSLLQQLGYVALVALGAYLVTQNQLTMGGLIACTIINSRALGPIAQLPSLMVQWQHARAAIGGLDKLISLPNELDEAGEALIPESLEGGIRFEKARFAYGAKTDAALELGRLEIRPGEKVGIIGAIGSGKSTLLKLASGLYRPAEGKVFLGGIDMAMLAPAFVRECIAYLPQEIRLVSGTLRENLLQGLPDPGDEALLQAARETGLIALISNHPKGLAAPITEGGRGISGGQRQLVGLTRMLLARPNVMLFDEPTASMDSHTEARVVAILKAKAAEGVTLIVATHKNALLPVVDRLLLMQGGRVLMDGPRDLVLAKLSGALAAAAVPLRKDNVATAVG